MMGAFVIRGRRAIGRARRVFLYSGLALVLDPCAAFAGVQDPASAGVWDLNPEQRWQVSEGLRIGERDGEGPAVFGYARCVAVDPMDRIWVADVEADEIRVFGADGKFVRTVRTMSDHAREFQDVRTAFPGPAEEIWVVEHSVRQYQVYDTAGTWIESHEFVLGRGPGLSQAWTRQGLMVVREATSPNFNTVIFHERVDGALRATGRTVEWPKMRFPTRPITTGTGSYTFTVQGGIPFATRPAIFFGSDLDLWLAGQIGLDRYGVARVALGTLEDLLAITHRYEPVAVPDSLRRAAADSLIARHTGGTRRLLTDIDWRDFPRQYPAFEGIHVSGNGEVWVRRTLAGGIVGFDVFAPDGQFLGQPDGAADSRHHGNTGHCGKRDLRHRHRRRRSPAGRSIRRFGHSRAPHRHRLSDRMPNASAIVDRTRHPPGPVILYSRGGSTPNRCSTK